MGGGPRRRARIDRVAMRQEAPGQEARVPGPRGGVSEHQPDERQSRNRGVPHELPPTERPICPGPPPRSPEPHDSRHARAARRPRGSGRAAHAGRSGWAPTPRGGEAAVIHPILGLTVAAPHRQICAPHIESRPTYVLTVDGELRRTRQSNWRASPTRCRTCLRCRSRPA